MRIDVTIGELARAFARVAKVKVPRSGTMPVLENLRLEVNAKDRVLKVTRFNLEEGVQVEVAGCSVDGAESGEVLVSCALLKKIVGKLKKTGDIVRIQVTKEKKHHITVTCGNAFFEVVIDDVDQYPTLPDFPDAYGIDTDRDEVVRAFNSVLYAVSKDETRYNLNAVFVDPKHAGDLVATDGHRLAVVPAPGELRYLTSALDEDMLIPSAFLRNLVRDPGSGDSICWAREGMTIFAMNENVTMFCRRVEGDFPPWRQVIPSLSGGGFSGVFHRGDALDAIGIVQVACDEYGHGTLRTDGSMIVIESSGGTSVGRATIDITLKSEAPIVFRVHLAYLAEALQHFTGNLVSIEGDDPLSPVILRAQGTEEFAVVMPVRKL